MVRSIANHRQRGEAFSQTLAIESVMLTCVVDAEEERIVVVTVILDTYLNADMDKLVVTVPYVNQQLPPLYKIN